MVKCAYPMLKKVKKSFRVPRRLQGILWSQNVRTLRADRDKVPIIHHIFAFGELEDIRWLRKAYTEPELRAAFTQHPMKLYTPASWRFAQRVLGVRQPSKRENEYVKIPPGHL